MHRIGDNQTMDYLEYYYANYDEDGRLAGNHGQVEYLTTMKYIHEFIGCAEREKILEVGAGTGRYSIALAKEGYQVDALGYTIHNIRTHHGTALDLSRFEDEAAVRVTKKQGHILVAYCMNEATMIQFTFKAGKIWDCINNHISFFYL